MDAVGKLRELLRRDHAKRNADGSLTLYVGAKKPGRDKESNCLPSPDGTFSLYIRTYWGKEPIIDCSCNHQRSRRSKSQRGSV